MAGAGQVVVAKYDAVGGPAASKPGSDGHRMGPTDDGNYVVAYCGRHKSRRYAYWSAIRWGTPIKEKAGKIYYLERKRWRLAPPTKTEVLDLHEELTGKRVIPKTWIFNDFGHMTC